MLMVLGLEVFANEVAEVTCGSNPGASKRRPSAVPCWCGFLGGNLMLLL